MTPLSRGPYRQRNTVLATPRFILYRETVSTRVRVQGLSPPGMFAFSVPLQVGSGTSWWGTPVHEKGLPATMPGGLHVEMSPGQQHLIALIDLGLFRDSLPEDRREGIERVSRQHVLPASREAVARLGAALSTMLGGAQARPEMLYHPNAIRSMEEDLVAMFSRTLTHTLPPPKRIVYTTRQRGLRKAIEYLRSQEAGSLTVSNLCAAACLTERTLEYGFRETFGLSPLGFLRLRRYHSARRALLAADGKTATVQAIAQYVGIHHMGRFAVRYKELFGESPSQTLMKPPLETQSRLLPRQGLGLL